MRSGQGRSLGWAGGLALGLLAGCAANHVQIEQAVLSSRPTPAHLHAVADEYHVRCPDVLRVDIDRLPQYSSVQRVGPDGRINLGDAGRPCVDGETVPQIVRTVAETVSVEPAHVHVAVAQYNSQYLYLIGQVAGLQRAVAYQGPETVLDLLHRVGGLTPAAAPRDIRVIRPHIAEGKAPEVFSIDLAAIALRNEADTNIVLEPYDQIHIGQSRRSSFADCLPPWLRPIYQRACGMKRQSGVRDQGSGVSISGP